MNIDLFNSFTITVTPKSVLWKYSVVGYVETDRIQGECLLKSSLPDKASRTLVELRGLLSDSTCVLKAEPGKRDIKRDDPYILFISLHVGSFVKLAIMTGFIYFRVFVWIQRRSLMTSFKMYNVMMT